MTPRYVHDCVQCTMIGQSLTMDLYVCPQGNLRTIIGRYGDDGPDYISGDGMVHIGTPQGIVRLSFLKEG